MQLEESIEMNKDLIDTLTQSIQRAAEVSNINQGKKDYLNSTNAFVLITFNFREKRKNLTNMIVNRVKDGRKFLNLQPNLFLTFWQKQIDVSQNMKSTKDL